MKFDQCLQKATLIKRYKRFLADVEMADGQITTIHCPNTGSMKNCMFPGGDVWYSYSDNPKRKYRHTWELSVTETGDFIGINTGRANHIVREALESAEIEEFKNIDSIKSEVKYGKEGSRVDFLIGQSGLETYLEVKSVTLLETGSRGYFPDSVSVRGAKHLRELSGIVRAGGSALLVYCVQHTGIKEVCPAKHIDQDYCAELERAVKAGVKVLALGTSISTGEIKVDRVLPVVIE